MQGLRPAARAALLVLVALELGQGVSSSAPRRIADLHADVHADVHHDISAPIHAVKEVLNRIPPLGGEGESDSGEALPPIPRTPMAARDSAVQTSVAGQAPSPSASFDGIDGRDGYMPPDPNGDVGPHEYVQVVNDSFAVYSKSGQRLLGPKSVSLLWSGFGGMCEDFGQGDPVVLYDPLAGRFVISQFAFRYSAQGQPVGPFYECIGVTKTGDPTGAWYRYAFLISQTEMNDYPKLGVWSDGYYMTINQYDTAGNWGGVGVAAFDREAMVAGQGASMVYLDGPSPDLMGLLPADLDGPTPPPPGSPEYLVGFDSANWGSALDLWRFHVDWANPGAATFTGPSVIQTAPFKGDLCGYSRDCVPQPGTGLGLDAMPYRLMHRLAYRNFGDHESLVVNHTVDVGSDHAGVRWYEIRDPAAQPYVYQQGTFAPDLDNRFMGSIAMDGAGDIGLGYTVSSSNTYPSVRYTGRLASDPLDEMPQGEGTLVAGSGSQTNESHRWGDYSSMSVDPADDCTFWYTNEYYKTTNPYLWSTRIGSFRFPSCAGAPGISVDDATVDEGDDGTTTDAVFTVTLTPAQDSTATVDYATEDGSAVGGEDYQAVSGTLTFQPGETTQTVSVPVLGDSTPEPDEDFSLVLSNASGAPIVDGAGTGTIRDDDGIDQPDGVIRAPSAHYVGDNVYNVTGRHQTGRARLTRGVKRVFTIKIENDGTTANRFKVRGPHSTRTFLLRYRSGSGANITRRVTSGRETLLVPAGRVRTIRLVVKATRYARRGLGKSFLVVVTSQGWPPHRDAVRAKVRVARIRH